MGLTVLCRGSLGAQGAQLPGNPEPDQVSCSPLAAVPWSPHTYPQAVPPLSTVCADHPPQIQPKPLPQGHTTPAICSPPSLPHLQSHARPLPVTCSAQRPGSLQPSTPPVDESATSSGPAMVSAHCLSLPHFHVGGAPAVDTFTLWGYSAIWASSGLALRLCLLHQQGAAHKSISAEH